MAGVWQEGREISMDTATRIGRVLTCWAVAVFCTFVWFWAERRLGVDATAAYGADRAVPILRPLGGAALFWAVQPLAAPLGEPPPGWYKALALALWLPPFVLPTLLAAITPAGYALAFGQSDIHPLLSYGPWPIFAGGVLRAVMYGGHWPATVEPRAA